MEKILFIGLTLLSLLGAGAVGTMMTEDNMGMMQGTFVCKGSWGCPMMDDEEIHMDEHCIDLTYEECEEMHEECEENMHKYCEYEIGEGEEAGHGCPMRHWATRKIGGR